MKGEVPVKKSVKEIAKMFQNNISEYVNENREKQKDGGKRKEVKEQFKDFLITDTKKLDSAAISLPPFPPPPPTTGKEIPQVPDSEQFDLDMSVESADIGYNDPISIDDLDSEEDNQKEVNKIIAKAEVHADIIRNNSEKKEVTEEEVIKELDNIISAYPVVEDNQEYPQLTPIHRDLLKTKSLSKSQTEVISMKIINQINFDFCISSDWKDLCQ